MYAIRKTASDAAWFRHDRFGMFIHFGLYALPARHEWVKTLEHISEENYSRYFPQFDPDLLDMREWAKTAKAAGMKYAVLTTKHHEGFCLFDSQYTDYKATSTPCGRDLVREFVEAFRAEGLKVGLYYSLIDWHHPDFPIDIFHPRRGDADAEQLDKGRDMDVYAAYLHNQVRELMTNYGKIDILWLDFSYQGEGNPDCRPWMQFGGGKSKEQWHAEELMAMARELQPGVLINNRMDIDGDFWTPEQFQPTDWIRHPETGERVTWEACQTFSGSWGYHRDESSWKSHEMLIEMLVNTVACGGNLIMNVGPTGRGYFDDRAVSALNAYGEWMRYNSRSIYGCTMAEENIEAPSGVKLTQSEDGKRLYVHLQTYPFGCVTLKGLTGRVAYAQFLHDASELYFRDEGEGTNIYLPAKQPRFHAPVIEVVLK